MEQALQVERDRNQLIFLLLIVVTLMILASFLFAFFVLDNFNVPCDINRGVGPDGKRGKQGEAGADSTITGPKGLQPLGPSPNKGPKGEPGLEETGDTGDVSTLGTGYPGEIGDTGDTGPGGFDGLVTPGLLFLDSGNPQALLAFYTETEILVKTYASAFTEKVHDVPFVFIRMGSIVTMNIYPFLIYKSLLMEPWAPGVIQFDLFNAKLLLPEYAPPREMFFPVIISKFTVTNSNATSEETVKATQTNVDWGGILQITPGLGAFLYGYWSVLNPKNILDPTVDNSRVLFKADESPFGLEGIVSVTWQIGDPLPPPP